MKRSLISVVLTLCVGGSTILSSPAESICWGSLVMLSKTTSLRSRCPNPSLTRTWRIRCYDGCGYSRGTFERSLSGFGECFKEQYCKIGIKCLPLAGSEILRFSPPSLTSTMINREGFYGFPCDLPGCRTSSINTIYVDCPCDSGGRPSSCAQNDPLIVSLTDGHYRLTDRAGGVDFDLGDQGVIATVPWTDPRGDEAFLTLDRNGNGVIDNGSELFGDVTPQHPSAEPNGFLALALFDDALSGGNEDGRISAGDDVFTRLRLWRDANHNGLSESSEIMTLDQAGLVWVDLAHSPSSRVDRHGNRFRFRGRSGWVGEAVRPIWNVYLTAP